MGIELTNNQVVVDPGTCEMDISQLSMPSLRIRIAQDDPGTTPVEAPPKPDTDDPKPTKLPSTPAPGPNTDPGEQPCEPGPCRYQAA